MFGFMGGVCGRCGSGDEKAEYRSFFCGLSGCLSREYSPVARFLVNRDAAFLSMVTSGLSESGPVGVMTTCCNPVAVRRPLYEEGTPVEYAAAVTMCGLSAKLRDDREDERGVRRLLAKAGGRMVEGMTDRAVGFLNTVGFPTAGVMDVLAGQEKMERGGGDLHESASATGLAYGEIFGFGGKLFGGNEGSLRRAGESLGRLIYWRDAWDDYEDDVARGRFNPLTSHSRDEMRAAAGGEAVALREGIQETGLRSFSDMVQGVISSTFWRHEDLIPMAAVNTAEEQEERRNRQARKEEQRRREPCGFCDRCSCCDCSCPSCSRSGSGSTCDACFDCGPGDSGCCDCGDCCPCN